MTEITTVQLYLYSLISTLLISTIPILFLFLIPFIPSTNKLHKNDMGKLSTGWLTGFLCFAAGALIGDAFLHLINGHGEHGSDHSGNNHSSNGLAVLSGILIFFGIELFSSSACPCLADHYKKSDELIENDHANANNHINSHSHSHSHSHSNGPNGFLSLLADSIHNFTDGLTIAAAYASSTAVGISTTIAIFIHEIPHELGDYAVLIKAGFTHPQVLKCQFMTAGAAFLGTFVGLLLQSQSSKNDFLLSIFKGILPFSAGGFIYLALASIVPEILKEKRCKQEAFLQFFLFTMGILLMTILE